MEDYYGGYTTMIRKLLFNDNWKFTKYKIGVTLSEVNNSTIPWTNVDIPHDWLIYDTDDLYETGEGWYKKEFVIDQITNKVISICFEGVYMDSTVYVNNEVAGEWKYGYSSFEFDITKFLRAGLNEIKVRVVYQSPNTRWYSGAGIYRNVWLKTTDSIHLVYDGTYLSTRQEKGGWIVELETESINQKEMDAFVNATIKHTILDHRNTEVATSQQQLMIGNHITHNTQTIRMDEPILWNPDYPYLYYLKTQIIIDGVTVDEEIQKFGFRTICLDTEKGFFLNDVPIKLHGACQHHDLGALGAAVNKTAIQRQLLILQQMGVNAVRLTHNMPSVEMMELADEMGILIISEAFDMWEMPKNDYDYSRFFNEWCEKDVASWIRRDRNHPSIIMWSIGNEIPDTNNDRGLEITKMLKNLVLLHDPKKNGHVTIGSNHMTGEKAQNCSAELLVAGYNYAERLYEEHHAKYPEWYIYGSETSSTLQSRGIYHFPANKTVVMYEDEQCSSLDNCTTIWGSKNTQTNIIYDRDATFCMGQFIWTGFDYIGEPTPYTTKNSYFGQIDTAGFAKDSFYLYQAEWTDYRTKPMVHLLPYWDFNKGQLIDIIAYTNAPKVELFFNDVSIGICDIDHVSGKQLSGQWQLPYYEGTLKAVAYDENMNIIATDLQRSFGDAATIMLKPDKTSMKADGQDLIFVEISMNDEGGTPVANANNRVEVEVTGAGRLVGLDNGDSTDYDQYKGTSRRLFSGKLLAIIAAKTEPGDIHMKVSSNGLTSTEITFNALPSEVVSGLSADIENEKSVPDPEIPIRKIQLFNHGINILNKQNPCAVVTASLFPKNHTYHEIEWKVVTAVGIETSLATVDVHDNTATITACGDGEFRLRCIAKNGAKIPQIISDLEFVSEGIGTATTIPYRFVNATLYNTSNYEAHNSLIGGIDTEDNATNIIGFEGLDFGDYGSDEVTLSLYYPENTPVPLEIWAGTPGDQDALQLLRTTYQADFVWSSCQSNTYKLPIKLKGLTTLSFVFYNKLSFEGFEFTYIEKAFEKLTAKDVNKIYGDSYTVVEDAINHIGNNVSLDFESLNFGSDGITKLILFGKANSNNIIHIHFESESGNINQIIEFPYSDSCIEKEFLLDKVISEQKVTLVFMPGCNFDFQWCQFMK